MEIIIPLTGNGSRFVNAGYSDLKPLIKVNGKPIIEWVCSLFPNDQHRISFICREEHFTKYPSLKRILKNSAPGSQIITIDNWKKKGPAFDVLSCIDKISNSEIIISYCDYFMVWDYKKFKRDLKKLKPDGAIPCYTGFHPHLIPKKNLYASCKINSKKNLIKINEMNEFNKKKELDFNSPGLYYFKNKEIIKKYFQKMIDAEDMIGGEYYVSLPFNYLVKDGLKVWCPSNTEFFCQWGTPEDLEEFNYWSTCLGMNK